MDAMGDNIHMRLPPGAQRSQSTRAQPLGYFLHGDVGGLPGGDLTPQGYDDPRAQYESHLAFRNSRIRFVSRARHFPWTEQPKAFYHALDDFLK